MATKVGIIKDRNGDNFLPQTDVSLISGLEDISSIRQGASAGSSAYQKPQAGIPTTDLNSTLQAQISSFITKSVNDLTNYYLKSETYTKLEVQGLIAAISQFHYEIYASTSAVTSPANNVLYLIGPTGSGADKYEEYVWPNSTQGFVKIGDTSIDLSGYVTTTALSTALADYTTTANLTTLLAGKQNTIDANNPLSSDLVQYESEGETIYVDLGLTSGTLWAKMNVGAESETEYGNYYRYGFGSTEYNSSQGNYSGTENPLSSSADTATQVWGSDWHTPTETQWEELIANTTYEWTTIDNVNGCKFISQNGNYIFLPAAGYYNNGNLQAEGSNCGYLSSTPGQSGTSTYNTTYYFLGTSSSGSVIKERLIFGMQVRPVADSTPTGSGSGSSMTLTEKIEEIEDNIPTTMGASGSSHKGGLVPDTSSTAGTNKYLREDAQWVAQATTTDIAALQPPAGELDPQDWEDEIANKQDKIDASNKLSADYIIDGTTNKVINVKPDWNAAAGTDAEILNKPTIPDITGKEDKTEIVSTAKTSSFTASVGNYYKINIAASGSITVTLSTPSDNSTLSSIVFFVTTSTSPSLTFSAASGVTVYRSKNYSIGASSTYEVTALWNGTNWSLTSLELTSV